MLKPFTGKFYQTNLKKLVKNYGGHYDEECLVPVPTFSIVSVPWSIPPLLLTVMVGVAHCSLAQSDNTQIEAGPVSQSLGPPPSSSSSSHLYVIPQLAQKGLENYNYFNIYIQ